jgi:hypothetical protein
MMTKDSNQRQVDSGVKKGQTELPDRSGRLTGHTKQPMKGEPGKEAQPGEHTIKPEKPQTR